MTSHNSARVQRDRAICAALDRPVLLPELTALVVGYDRRAAQRWCQEPEWVPIGVSISSDGSTVGIANIDAKRQPWVGTFGIRGSENFETGACRWSLSAPAGTLFYAGIMDVSVKPLSPFFDHENCQTAYISLRNEYVGYPYTEMVGVRLFRTIPIFRDPSECVTTIQFEADVDAGTLAATVNGRTAKIFEGLDLRRCAPYCSLGCEQGSLLEIRSQPE